MSSLSFKWPDGYYKDMDHQKYLARITKTLYYGKLPKTERLSLPVTELAAELFSEAQCGKSLERLHLNTASNISRNACVSPCSLILAMLYLERLKICNPEYLERTNPSDLFLVSLMISSKFLFDDGEFDEVFIDEWANSAGISVSELVKLERKFLEAIDWEIYVKEINFWKKFNQLETELAKREGNQRGFFTYTEMINLSKLIELNSLIQCIMAMTMLIAVTYTAGILTIIGSFYITSQIPGNALIKTTSNDINLTTTTPTEITKTIEPADILRTSLFLTFISPFCNKTDTILNKQEIKENETDTVTWKWWKTPSMIWLTEISKIEINFEIIIKYFVNYIENLNDTKNLYIGNHINMNKATKTRIQDQLESSWHKEWIDTISHLMFYNIPNVKVV